MERTREALFAFNFSFFSKRKNYKNMTHPKIKLYTIFVNILFHAVNNIKVTELGTWVPHSIFLRK